MNIIIRVDASTQIGSGHVMRCLTLADSLRNEGAQCYFICRHHSGNMIDYIRSRNHMVLSLPTPSKDWLKNKDDSLEYTSWLGTNITDDATQTISTLNSLNLSSKPSLLIADHYAINTIWEDLIKPYCKRLMVIDDLANRKHNCDILLDQTFERNALDYQRLVPENCTLLIGSQYALLRPEFSAWRKYSLKRRSPPPRFKNILISLGAIDNNNITCAILQTLNKTQLPKDSNITVIMGANAPWLTEVRKIADSLPWTIEIKVDVQNMAQIITSSDLCIGAAGSTTWERCCLGLPTIMLVIAQNQETIANILRKKEAVLLLEDVEELPNLMNILTKGALNNLSKTSRKICDGRGSKRTIKALNIIKDNNEKNKTQSIRKMTKDDLDLVLSWRNHIDIRRFMHTQHKISQKEHENWFKRSSIDPHQHLLIFENNNSPQGFIKFTATNNSGSFDWGFYLAPNTEKGMGRKLGNKALSFAFTVLKFDKICGQVFSYNERSINFHISLGFILENIEKPPHSENNESHSLLYFELQNNDWKENQELNNAKTP